MDIENDRGYNCNGSNNTREEEIQKEDESEVEVETNLVQIKQSRTYQGPRWEISSKLLC